MNIYSDTLEYDRACIHMCTLAWRNDVLGRSSKRKAGGRKLFEFRRLSDECTRFRSPYAVSKKRFKGT